MNSHLGELNLQEYPRSKKKENTLSFVYYPPPVPKAKGEGMEGLDQDILESNLPYIAILKIKGTPIGCIFSFKGKPGRVLVLVDRRSMRSTYGRSSHSGKVYFFR